MHCLNRTLRSLLAALCLMLSLTAVGAEPASTPAKAPEGPPVDAAPVIVNGEVLFQLRGITALPARQRTAAVAARIEKLADDKSFDPASLVVTDKGDYTAITAGEKLVVAILEEDAQLENVNRKILGDVYIEKIRSGIQDYRNDRKPEVLLRAALYAAVATVVFLALCYGVIVLFRRINAMLERHVRQRIDALEVKSMRIVQAQQMWTVVIAGSKVVRTLLILALIYGYLSSVLVLFPWTRWLARDLLKYVLDPLTLMGSAFVHYLPKLMFLIVLVFVARLVLKLVRVFFDTIGDGRVHLPNFEPEWAEPTYRIVRFMFVAFMVVIAYPYIPGSDSDAFKGVSLFLGILFSLGSSSVLSNVIAGYSMTYRRAFRIGDRVRIDQNFGDVTETSVLVTHILTPKNERVVIPNSKILNGDVINYSAMARDKGLILHTTVGIGYETPWRQVEAMLLMAAERTPGLKPGSQPFVLQQSLGDFAVNYELNVYSDDASRMNAQYTDLHRNIQDVFNEYGVQIMTPNYVSDTPEPKLVPKAQWYAAPAQGPGQE